MEPMTIEEKAAIYLREKCGLMPSDSYYHNILKAFRVGYNSAQETHEDGIQQVSADIKEFTAKWEASDRKMDALHLKEVNRLKNYIESILFAIARADHLCEVKRFVEINKPLSDILVNKKIN